MIGITNGFGTRYTAQGDITECTYELPQVVIAEDPVVIILEGCE